MPIDINGTIVSGGTSLIAKDSSNNNLYQQTSGGYTLRPTNSSGSTYLPLFNVGWSSEGWVSFGGSGSWYVIPFRLTSGSGYYNVGSCYNTGNYTFNAPLTGLYLFKSHAYIYYPLANIAYYTHPMFFVNGNGTNRRPSGGPLYRIRQYGLRADYGRDTDICEMMYLTAGDYVQSVGYVGNGMQGYAQYSSWNGAYLGN